MSDWQIPDERDQMQVPEKPDLRCIEHRWLLKMIELLKSRVRTLEERVVKLEDRR